MHPQNFYNDCFWPGYISTFKLSTNNYLLLIQKVENQDNYWSELLALLC